MLAGCTCPLYGWCSLPGGPSDRHHLVPGLASFPWGSIEPQLCPSGVRPTSWDHLVSKPGRSLPCCSCSSLALGTPSLSRELGGHRRTFVGGLAERDFLWPQAHLLPETEVLMDRAAPNQGSRELPTGRGLGSHAPGWYFPVGIPQLTWRTSLLTQLQRLTPKIWSPVLWGGPRMYVCNKSPRPPRSRWPMDWHWRL